MCHCVRAVRKTRRSAKAPCDLFPYRRHGGGRVRVPPCSKSLKVFGLRAAHRWQIEVRESDVLDLRLALDSPILFSASCGRIETRSTTSNRELQRVATRVAPSDRSCQVVLPLSSRRAVFCYSHHCGSCGPSPREKQTSGCRTREMSCTSCVPPLAQPRKCMLQISKGQLVRNRGYYPFNNV
jgi:hypothetical protein